MSKVANKKVILLVFLILRITIMILNCETKNEKDLNLNLSAVKYNVKINEPIEIIMKFSSKNGVYRLYKHTTLGIAAAWGILQFSFKFPGIKELNERHNDYEYYVSGMKYPFRCDHVDISPGNAYIELLKLYPGNKYEKKWPGPGIVKIKVTYIYKHKEIYQYGSDLWEGEIESNWVTVKVMK